MALDLHLFLPGTKPGATSWLAVGEQQIPVRYVRNRRARRYILRLQANGIARVTVPLRGSETEARQFAERQTPWLQRQLSHLAESKGRSRAWGPGTEILFRGETVSLRVEAGLDSMYAWVGSERIPVSATGDLRPWIEGYLKAFAARILPPRVMQLAAEHAFVVRRVTVRNQRSRWGSCSMRGTISLNWRLVQAPASVCDYIILHELAHLRHMNHSAAFWAEVERLCPGIAAAEAWLKHHGNLLR